MRLQVCWKYLEVNGLQKLVSRHVGVLGLGRVAIAQEDVMQPVWHDSVFIHQVANAFQHCLKVVLLQQKQNQPALNDKSICGNIVSAVTYNRASEHVCATKLCVSRRGSHMLLENQTRSCVKDTFANLCHTEVTNIHM